MNYLKKAGSDFIPIWDGSLEKWENYVVRCGIFTRGVEPYKVSNRIANLIQHLEPNGEPWKMIMNLSEEERVALQIIPEAMLQMRENAVCDLTKFSAIGIGPGIGTKKDSQRILKKVIAEFNKPTVFDADALNIISANKQLLSKITKGTRTTAKIN